MKPKKINSLSPILFLLFALFFTSCQRPPREPPLPFTPIVMQDQLSRVNIVEHSNLSETITNKERLKELAARDFLSPQPYKKVMRVFVRDQKGTSRSIITSYFENGQIQQYLECLNGRACGLYLEWYSSGNKKVQATLLAGQADLDDKSFLTWSFDGECTTWDEQGNKNAVFRYQKGTLEGISETFYAGGETRSITFYENGLKEGIETFYAPDGTIMQTVSFKNDLRDGPAIGYIQNDRQQWDEEYQENLLKNGHYFSAQGILLSSVQDGNGLRTLFSNEIMASQEEIKNGRVEGVISIFDEGGRVEKKYEIHDGQKSGPEFRYYPESGKNRLEINWHEGYIHGSVRTWYENGALESQKEMAQNNKNGISMTWYVDGSLMLVEEYANDKLVRGQYFNKGESVPSSSIEKGAGLAILHDQTGNEIEKIQYVDGKPIVEEA
jgi:antitoxin component YwqK of YwqJK toxin-antitoxin module